MPQLKLSTLAILLGLGYGLVSLFGVLKPAAFGTALRRFPRWTPIGYVLMITATAWFLANLNQESISDFASFKPALYALFGLVGIGACLFVQDFLPVRGLAVLLLLLGKLMVDTARWADTPWRLVITTWAYVFVIVGIWFTVSPWRMRDIVNWATATEQRTRRINAIRFAFSLLVVALGLTVYRAAENRPATLDFLDAPSSDEFRVPNPAPPR